MTHNNKALRFFHAIVASFFLWGIAAGSFAKSAAPWEFEFEGSESAVTVALEKAEKIFQSNQAAQGAYEYLGTLGELSQDLEIMVWRGWYASEAGLVEEAEEIYRTLIGRDPEDAWNYNALGWLLAKNKYVRLDEAVDLIERALELEPDDPNIHDSYGYAMQELGYLSNAERSFRQAVRLLELEEGYDPEIFYNYGALLLQRGKEEMTASILRTMYDQGEDVPGNIEAVVWLSIVRAIYRQEIGEETLEFLAEAKKENPEDPLFTLTYAFALHIQGNDDLAQRQLEAASDLIDETSDSELLSYYSDVLHRMGESKEAEKFLRFLINREPDNPWNYNGLGFLLAEKGWKLDEAAELLEQGLALAPERPELLDSYGWVLYRQGRHAAAVVMVERALDSAQEMGQYEEIETFTHHGEILWEMGYEHAAAEVWKQAWYMNSSHDKLRETLARYDQAFEEVDDDWNYLVESALAYAEYLAEEDTGAAYYYLSSIDLLFNSEPLMFAQAGYAWQAGLYEEAEALYRSLIDRNPEEAIYYNNLGYLLVNHTDRIVEAGLILEQALELSPNNPIILDSFGWALYRQERLEQALEVIKKSVRLMAKRSDPDELQARIEGMAHYGELLWERGERQEAVEVWREAWLLDNYTENEVLFNTLSRYSQEYRASFW